MHLRLYPGTNPLWLLNGRTKRRANVTSWFPYVRTLVCLVSAILSEQYNESTVAQLRYFRGRSKARLAAPLGVTSTRDLQMALP